MERVRRIEEVCERHAVPLTAAALQFPLAHPAVASLVVGMQIAGIGFRAAARYTLLIALLSIFLLLPLDYLWWRFIGYFD